VRDGREERHQVLALLSERFFFVFKRCLYSIAIAV
jgi:hypothetical protein